MVLTQDSTNALLEGPTLPSKGLKKNEIKCYSGVLEISSVVKKVRSKTYSSAYFVFTIAFSYSGSYFELTTPFSGTLYFCLRFYTTFESGDCGGIVYFYAL